MNDARFVRIARLAVSGARIGTKAPSEGQVRESVFRFLEDQVLCSMASVAARNRAHINTAYFCYSADLELYFLTHPRSLHCRNVARNRSMAIAIFSSSQRWTDPGRGLQLFGTCGEAEGAQAARAERLYAKRFPGYARWNAGLAGDDPARDYRFYRFRSTAVKILDEASFGDAVWVQATVERSPRSK